MTRLVVNKELKPIAVLFALYITQVMIKLIIEIIACSECVNFICYTCLEGYYKKNLENKVKMKCPFCNSATTIFIDYEL